MSKDQVEGGIGLRQAEEAPPRSSSVAAASRWRLLKKFLLTSSTTSAADDVQIREISRRPNGRYNLFPAQVRTADEPEPTQKGSLGEAGCLDAPDVVVEYVLPALNEITVTVRQRGDRALKLSDFAACGKNSIDSTGIVCLWPAEEVLTYFCARHPDIFWGKSVVELGAGYGLGGLAIASCTDATEVVITDGNPQVVGYVKHNIAANARAFGDTVVSGSALYWNRDSAPLAGRAFDLVVAADCTFFKDFHVDLAFTIKALLGTSKTSRAILFSPRRGDTLDLFVHVAESQGLLVEVKEEYDPEVWDIHQRFLKGDQGGWPNYDGNHCYPIFLSLRASTGALLRVTS